MVVDHVVAVVGNKPILASQVDEDLFAKQSQGSQVPTTDSAAMLALRTEILNNLIDQELMVQQALRDTTSR